jgi:hypothetical protein
MKKAKMLLAVIATFAIVGGVVAFKTKGNPIPFYYYTANATLAGHIGQAGCLKPVTLELTTVDPSTPGAVSIAATTAPIVTNVPSVCQTSVVALP